VDLNADEWTSDINNVAGLLKMWLRDLPDPLMTKELQAGFLEAASTYSSMLIVHVVLIVAVLRERQRPP
jgi:Rho GTPase-activating protein RGD1